MKQKSWISIAFSFASQCKWRIILSVIFAIIGVFAGIVPYWCIYKIITLFVNKNIILNQILYYCIIAVLGYGVRYLFHGISTTLSHFSAYKILENIRLSLAKKLIDAPLGYVLGESVGKLKSVIVDRVETIELPLAHVIPECISNITLSISVFAYLVDNSVDPVEIQNNIRNEFAGQGVYPLLSQSMMNEVSTSTQDMIKYVYILIALVWLLVFLVLTLVYSITIKERKREFATLRILGASKKHLRRIILSEIFTINISGAACGSVLGLIISILFGTWFSQSFKMPFLAPNVLTLAIIFVAVFAIGTIMGPLSSLISIKKMNAEELGLLLRQND